MKKKANKKTVTIAKAITDAPPTPDISENSAKALNPSQKTNRFPIVGIGASAGGLAAFEDFFSGMPAEMDQYGKHSDGPGMAFVLVQHLAPDHKSILVELVKRYTRMQVFEIKDGMTVKPNCAYIIPPAHDIAYINGKLQLLEPVSPHGRRLPIDFFFRSLAQELHQLAIGIILSGTGSDGTLGARAIKDEGGMIMVQNPESAAYDGMPRSAIASALVDYELPANEMPAQLISYVTNGFGKPHRQFVDTKSIPENALNKLFLMVRSHTGHDFSLYKSNTINRRIDRRMAVARIKSIEEYVNYCRQTPDEIQELFRDLLIGVTNFFRDPEAFKFIETKILARLFETNRQNSVIRVWVPACSTGEEAYSIAILFAEQLDLIKRNFEIQLFATDIDSEAITTARTGIYPANIKNNISPKRLARFFTLEPSGDAYRINKNIRDMLIFSEQDVIKDPPFSKLDLISCRNLLIYMSSELQKKLIHLFHYALNPGAYLFLGTSESVGEDKALFAKQDRNQKVYLRKENLDSPYPLLINGTFPRITKFDLNHSPLLIQNKQNQKLPLRELTEQTILKQIAPTAILVNSAGDILFFHGRSGMFLEPAPGVFGVANVLKMAREGLQRDLTTALHKVKRCGEVVECKGLKVKTNGDYSSVDISVSKVDAIDATNTQAPLFLIILKLAPLSSSVPLSAIPQSGNQEDQRIIATLQKELLTNKEYLQSTIEELETTNEELKSSSEEMQSINEELQSTNEELETAKEELQSINEELSTVNAELQSKVSDLSHSNNDMNNLLAGTGIGTLFVDQNLEIMRFTPTITKIINLIATDIGRPVSHILSNLKDYVNLIPDIKEVLDTLVPKEMEVQTTLGVWHIMRIQAYRTLENVIEGAVITFVNITKLKLIQQDLSKTQVRTAEDIVRTVREPLLVLDAKLQVITANRSFYNTFKVDADETLGQLIYNLGNQQWDIPALQKLLKDILPQNTFFNDYKITHKFEKIGLQTMRLNARQILSNNKKLQLILLAIEVEHENDA